ncbi:BnaC04g48120D [Brassica napus]|uniref:BnaC04g48120D protein n=1 Tax=Brassica napus TaxID=3708 RepID=A0A078FK54_BRANA|nr:BnaC04g48120D [Brassica napus]
MNIGSNSGQGRGPGQAESGGSSNESSSFSGGLMFGQKIYFEDGGGGSSSSAGSNRRVRGGGSGHSSQTPRCQVEGCKMDLTNAKGYYSRHRVCGMHLSLVSNRGFVNSAAGSLFLFSFQNLT